MTNFKFHIDIHISKFIYKTKFSVQFQTNSKDSFSTHHQIQIQIKMSESNHLCDLWEYTIAKIFKHDSKSELRLMLKQWILFNKLENFKSILNYPIEDFTPSGNLCYMNEHGDILPYTPMIQIFNLRW